MRIVIVGDLQYEKNESIDGIVDDVRSLAPDTVVLLGDYGYWEGYGSYEVFSQIAEAFKGLDCKKFIPLIGNHDVQWEAGERKMKRGTVAENYERALGFPPQNRVLEFEDFRVFCIHTDIQKKDDFWFASECYVTDEHFGEITAELEKYPDKPVIMITHAPPAVSGLLTVPHIHIRASNAYLNQDHGYQKWIDLTRDYRQIIMWFNGHYHMGHRHKNSMLLKDSLAYFITGTATLQSRDGQKHTRVIDAENGEIRVSTYDHDTKMLSLDYSRHAQVRGEKEGKTSEAFSAGCGKVLPDGLKCGKNGRVYAMTDNGYLWEIDVENGIATGVLHYSDKYKLEGFSIDREYVWRICGDEISGHRYDDLNRFMREKDYDGCSYITKSRTELPRDLCETFVYEGKIACRMLDGRICTSFNDKDGGLYFKSVEQRR